MPTTRCSTPPRRFPLALAIPLLAVSVAGGIVALSTASSRPAVPPKTAPLWSARRAAAIERVNAHPGDLEAELWLSRVMAKEATAEVQEVHAALPRSRRGPYSAYLAACLRRSVELAEAEALARHVATKGGNARLRARAWSHLAGISQLLDDRSERLRRLGEAAREDPAQFASILRAAERSETAIPSRSRPAATGPR